VIAEETVGDGAGSSGLDATLGGGVIGTDIPGMLMERPGLVRACAGGAGGASDRSETGFTVFGMTVRVGIWRGAAGFAVTAGGGVAGAELCSDSFFSSGVFFLNQLLKSAILDRVKLVLCGETPDLFKSCSSLEGFVNSVHPQGPHPLAECLILDHGGRSSLND